MNLIGLRDLIRFYYPMYRVVENDNPNELKMLLPIKRNKKHLVQKEIVITRPLKNYVVEYDHEQIEFGNIPSLVSWIDLEIKRS